MSVKVDNKAIIPVTRLPCVSYEGMRRFGVYAREFTLYYLPIYNPSEKELYECYRMISLYSGLVGQADAKVELYQQEAAREAKLSLGKTFPWDSSDLDILLSLLKELNIDHHSIRTYWQELKELFDLETKLMLSRTIDYEDLIRAAELRTSDYRLLHSILVQLLGKPYRKEIFDIFWSIEVWLDIVSDIDEYEKDVGADNYNNYRMLVKLYGEEAPHYLKKQMDYYENLCHTRVQNFLGDDKETIGQIWSRYRQELLNLMPTGIPAPIIE